METGTRIVEINGVKLELDMRQATLQSIDAFKVGDSVKVLVKNYSDYASHAGVIVGFDAFKNLPTIIVAYLKISYSDAKLEFAYINAQSTDVELCAASPNDVPFERATVLQAMDRDIATKKEAAAQAENNKAMFLSMFNRYFAEYAKVADQVDAL